MAEAAQQLQLVDRGGACDEGALREFCGGAGRVGVAGHAYAVVAVMGPQSSGKSTLLNALYGTRFVEMDAMSGRGQTTKGIWLAQAVPAQAGGVLPLVMDLEGTDGRERGEDDAAFEAQSALFALAAADVLLVNCTQGSVIRLLPAMNLTDQQAEEGCDILCDVIQGLA